MIWLFLLITIVCVVYIFRALQDLSQPTNKIERLLRTQKFREADIQTKKYLIRLSKTNKESFSAQNFASISCSDLREIDKLWRQYSNSKFGYSIQKTIIEKYGIEEYDNLKEQFRLLNSSPRDSRISYLSQDGFAYRVGWLDFTASCWNGYSPERGWLDYFQYLPNQKGELIAIDIRHAWLMFGVCVNKYDILPDPRTHLELINDLERAPIGHYPSWCESLHEREHTWSQRISHIYYIKIMQCF